MPPAPTAVISTRGAQRWARGHPWVFRGDLIRQPDGPAGAVAVVSERGRPLGSALWSPASEISLRFIERDPNAAIDADWWRARIAAAIARREHLAAETTACRLIHGEADGCPSLVCDRYDRWLVVQLLSAGLEAFREVIVGALVETTGAAGLLARHDVTVRDREGLPRNVELLTGDVPDEIEIVEHGVRYLAAPRTGQKTGAFLDQRENRVLIGRHSRGRALDCFSYHGSFALHLARGADHVTALDTSGPALARARENANRNGFTNIETLEADAFDYLKAAERGRERFDTIVLDPPAFAKSRAALPAAIRGYKEINLRAMRLLSPGGTLFSASCSFHLSKPAFLEMLADAAGDSGRTIVLRAIVGQPSEHPEVLTIPETGYIKGALLTAV
jgi:23S rRNA (cytosine1962-C5)-methyltransferase